MNTATITNERARLRTNYKVTGIKRGKDVKTSGTTGAAMISKTCADDGPHPVKKQKKEDFAPVLSTPGLENSSEAADIVMNVTPDMDVSDLLCRKNNEKISKKNAFEVDVIDLTKKSHQVIVDSDSDKDQTDLREMDLKGIFDKFVKLGLHKFTERYEISSTFEYRDFIKWLYEKNKKPNMSSLGWIMEASFKLKNYDAYMDFLQSFFDYFIDFMRTYGEDIVHTRLIPHSKSFIALWQESGGYVPNGWCSKRCEQALVSTLPIIDSATCKVKNTAGDLDQHKKDHPSQWMEVVGRFVDEDDNLKNCSYFKNAFEIDGEMDPDTVTEQLELRGMKVKRVKATTRCHRLAMVGQIKYDDLPSAWFNHDHMVGKRAIDEYLGTYDDALQPFLKVPSIRAAMLVNGKRRIDLAYLECLVQAMIDFSVDEYEPLHLLYLKVVKGKDDPSDPTDIDDDEVSSLGCWSEEGDYF